MNKGTRDEERKYNFLSLNGMFSFFLSSSDVDLHKLFLHIYIHTFV